MIQGRIRCESRGPLQAWSDFGPTVLAYLKFAKEPERLDEMGQWASELTCSCTRKADRPVGHFPLHHILRLSSSSNFRIVERLADEGWDEQILSHRAEYLRYITAVDGVCVTRPLVEKGTRAHALENIQNLRTIFSLE